MADAEVEKQPVSNNDNAGLLTEQELEKKAAALQRTLLGSCFPVLGIEAERFILMASIFFLIAFCYTFLRLFKDTVIHSVLEPSAQNWLKLLTFFASVIAIGFIQSLLVTRNMDAVFEISTFVFGALFLVLAALIKFRSHLQFRDGWAEALFVADTASLRGREVNLLYMVCLMFNHWILSAFYTLSEVIGSTMVSYLFMTYVNSHCTADQNSRFVRILYICSNIAGLVASQLYGWWNRKMKLEPYETSEAFYGWFSLAIVALFGLIILLKRRLDTVFKAKPIVATGSAPKKVKKKAKVSIGDGLYLALVSRLLMAMCGMTLFYNISANMLTSIFTNALSCAAAVKGESKNTFAAGFKSTESAITHVVVILVLVSPVSRLMERFGVLCPGSLPIIISFVGAVSSCYYAMVNFPALGEDNMAIAKYWNYAERCHTIEIWCGLLTQSAIKISKYAFFDIVKEAISMKINPEIRPLFKGVFDGVCGKLGKCAGSAYGIFMEGLTGKRDARYYAPVTGIILCMFCFLWTIAIYYLHKAYKNAKANNTYLSPDYFKGVVLKGE